MYDDINGRAFQFRGAGEICYSIRMQSDQPNQPAPAPAAQPSGSPDAPQPSPAPQSTPPPAGRKVLCIEDEHFIGELYTRALSKAGYQVTLVTDGEQALTTALTDEFDIILLDLMVPNMTGIEILRKLRDPAGPQLKAKIIIITNLEQREDVRADIERQADGYLVKAELTPHELADFLDTVK